MKPRPGSRKLGPTLAALASVFLTVLPSEASATPTPATDPRLREVVYSPQAVVSVPLKRGIVALIALDGDESIADLAAGLGGDCSKTESAWCITAQPGARHFFVKAKSQASVPNNVVVVTDRRHHSFRFVVLADEDPREPVHRLVVRATPAVSTASLASSPAPLASVTPQRAAPSSAADVQTPLLSLLPQWAQLLTAPPSPAAPPSPQLVADRLSHRPQVLNSAYALAEGAAAQDIVPTLVFDDGRFTYFKFPGHRELPAVFHVLPDGSETLVNARMEDELLVVDRVARRLMLRAGSAAVGIWNEAFDIDGDEIAPAPGVGTTVPGVQRLLKSADMTARPSAGATGGRP